MNYENAVEACSDQLLTLLVLQHSGVLPLLRSKFEPLFDRELSFRINGQRESDGSWYYVKQTHLGEE